jgi:hypothetical protein
MKKKERLLAPLGMTKSRGAFIVACPGQLLIIGLLDNEVAGQTNDD